MIAARLHDVKYGERTGNVAQIWEDGEITKQKSGVLLNCRRVWTV